ncbi:MAG: transglutaminase-like domain-containing protein [Candidatus Omnitrophota bacterium]
MMSALIQKEILRPTHTSHAYSLIIPRDVLIRDYWMGIYYNNRRIGYTNTIIQPQEKDKRSGFKINNRTFLALSVMGTARYVLFEGSSVLGHDLKLDYFKFNLKSGNYSTEVTGRMGGENVLKLDIATKNYRTTRLVELGNKKDVIFAGLLNPFDSFARLVPGQVYAMEVFDPFTMQIEKTVITVNPQEEIELKDKKYKAYNINVAYKGFESNAWVDKEGNVLKQQVLGWTMIREDAREATCLDKDILRGESDIIALVSIPSNVAFGNKNVKYLKVKLTGLYDDFDVYDERQQSALDEHGIIEINTENIAGINVQTLPLSIDDQEEFSKYLAGTPFIQTEEEQIRNLAREIVGEEKNSWRATVKLVEWVYQNIEKTPAISIPSALDVLKTRRGDCNEHTILFTALSRSIKIPTKICVGLVCLKEKFYYHAWPRVWVGGWVSVDPTFGQLIADATHIKLLEGGIDQQTKLVKILGKLKVEVMDYQ